MNKTPATLRKPTGFSDPEHYDFDVFIVGFTYGKYAQAGGAGEGTLAVISEADGQLKAVPIAWLRLPPSPPTPSDRKIRE